MRTFLRIVLVLVAGGVIVFAFVTRSRTARVDNAAAAIPVYPGATEAAKRIRYWPRFMAWDDRSSARVDRVFSLSDTTNVLAIARHADATLATEGWYLVLPHDLRPTVMEPQVIVWQRDPDERLDLAVLWPIAGMTRTQRMHGGLFPAHLLDAPRVIGWTWFLGGARSARPVPRGPSIVYPAPPP